MKFNTKVIHGGQIKEKGYGAVMPPIYQTSTYAQSEPGVHEGYEYSRTQNPTRHALENSIASLENAKYGLAFSSGLSAIDAILKLFKPGDEIISTHDLYGGSYRLFNKIYKKYGLKFIFEDLKNLEKVEKLITSKTKLVWVETPTNPMINVIDIAAISEICKENERFRFTVVAVLRNNEALVPTSDFKFGIYATKSNQARSQILRSGIGSLGPTMGLSLIHI